MMNSPLSDWVPYRLVHNQDQPICRWLKVGNTPFAEPFFADTIGKCKSAYSYRQHSASSIELLPEWSAELSCVQPSAFIFHISRCGSTLLSQLLGINPAHIVLSEVPFFDEVLRYPFQKQSAGFSAPAALQAAVRFYGQQRTGQENRLFIKTDSWHVCFYNLLRKLYPATPFILLYRKPEEVIRSQQRKRGMHAVPGVIEPEIFGFEKEPVMDLDAYTARIIERYLSLFVEIIEKDECSLLVNYNEGMLTVLEQVASFTRLDISPQEYEKMEERGRYHAKYPDQVFSEPAADGNVPGYLQKSMELYRKLEQKRMFTPSFPQE